MDQKAQLDKALRRMNNLEKALNESTIVAVTDQHGVIQSVNDKFCSISKYSRDELVGNTHQIVNSGYHSPEVFKDLWKTIETGQVWRGEIRNRAKDGSYYWVDTTIVPFFNEDGELYQYIALHHDITARMEYEEAIKKLAFYDPLTALPNRNALNQWLDVVSATNHPQFTVLFLDFDRFKSVNDKFGHHMGDYVLKEVSRRLKYCLSKTDFISRLGWDEFIVVLRGEMSQNDIKAIVKKLIQQLSMSYDVRGLKISLSISVGISTGMMEESCTDGITFIESLINKADTAMGYAKAKGGNSYCFNTPDQNTEIDRYYQIEQEIKTALEKDEFTIYYQPIIRLQDNKMIGAEALLRWYNPKLGHVSPAEFIPILEELGLIIPTGKWILKTATKQMKQWQEDGVHLDKICVNVSPIQFHHDDFTVCLQEILEETELDPRYLELEITEGTLLNIDETHDVFESLRAIGIHISIDDFGTGYSSLGYLKKLPINTLKMDRSFIFDMDSDGEIIVNTMINMGKNLHYTVLAEGIEQKEQLDYLAAQGCDLGQGFYWSKPVPAKSIHALYKNFNN
ncbi:MAG TPA: EAL domain-containing protein [Cerasibacillus sp.]|uniref:putative bifunctional diguanylate cyclase/phosphodiesterase n=1 Tax=Cerasibacillus sp. TaxID=2498711 RepID=UPI002F41F725